MYEIVLARTASKDLAGLPLRRAESIAAALRALAEWPHHNCDVRPLKGPYAGKWRLRVGEYRVIFAVDDAAREIEIARIAPRGQVY